MAASSKSDSAMLTLVLKKERSKRLVTTNVANHYYAIKFRHESILRQAAPEFATSITVDTGGEFRHPAHQATACRAANREIRVFAE